MINLAFNCQNELEKRKRIDGKNKYKSTKAMNCYFINTRDGTLSCTADVGEIWRDRDVCDKRNIARGLG